VKAIDGAAMETARQAIALADERALFVRIGHQARIPGSGVTRPAGAVAALFAQHDNCNGEPNLHVHTVPVSRRCAPTM
jgi:hypothetical protein